MSSLIPRHEIAPVTDSEWNEALEIYGRDRDEAVASSSRTPSPHRRQSLSSRPLVHHGDSDDSITSTTRRKSTTLSPSIASPDPMNAALDPSFNGNDDVDTPTGLGQNTRPPLLAFDTAVTIKAPLTTGQYHDDYEDDVRSGFSERLRMREFFEREGWLPGPEPCVETRKKRRRVVRRLGLIGEEEDGRKAVLAKYAEMAKLVFDATSGAVSILHDDVECAYTDDPDVSPHIRSAAESGASHVVAQTETRCLVIADQSKDWRCRNNPLRKSKPYKSVLLKLANMLVYQLATLQSEIAAKRSSAMYEASITFLRRSVMPDHAQSDERPSHEDQNRAEALTHPFTGSRGEAEESAQLATKSGPRGSKEAKAKAIRMDQDLFEDAANTLRKMLKADSVAIISMEDYQLFIRRNSNGPLDGKHGKEKLDTKERIINDYLKGKPWPEHVEAVINYVPRVNGMGIPVLGRSSAHDTQFAFNELGAEATLSEFLKSYLTSRQFWWDREQSSDPLSKRIMGLMPAECETALGTPFMGYDGKVRFAAFATWNRPPSSFMDSSTTGLSFVGILGGCVMAALAIRKMRGLDQSQISYSNLQAHELRTPLHQILAITQLLRSSMNDLAEEPSEAVTNNTTSQVKDLLPFLDAIDTSGKTLHGIVDNILNFLDLRGKEDSLTLGGTGMVSSANGSQSSLEMMFEDIIKEAIEEDGRSRRANGQPDCHVETVFEIIPPLLGEEVALSKILANAYKFLDDEGCVEITVDDVPDLLPPEGCEDIALTKIVSIVIRDNGKGMDRSFVHDKLGEPWAKEDRYATGSLSVHLAYRIIDLMGGCMEIKSAPGMGTTVQVDVPLPIRAVPFPESPEVGKTEDKDTAQLRELANIGDTMNVHRKVALVGFSNEIKGPIGLVKLGHCLERQYKKLGCDITSVEEAELIIANGHLEQKEREGSELLQNATTDDFVFLVAEEHEAHDAVVHMAKRLNKQVRRFRKPTTPSILRESLFRDHSKRLRNKFGQEGKYHENSFNTPDPIDRHGEVKERRQSQQDRQERERGGDGEDSSPQHESGQNFSRYSLSRSAESSNAWQTDSVPLEDAVASLSLGDYFNSRPRSKIDIAAASPGGISSVGSTSIIGGDLASSSGSLAHASNVDLPSSVDLAPENAEQKEEEVVAVQQEIVKVLVVEDNMINRKILVKLLTSKLPIRIIEAEDGQVAVDLFEDLSGPVVVLLDINMPRKDGYQSAIEMRAIEKADSTRQRAKIIAVTALASDAEKRKGLVECSMDDWLTKPCGKAMITKVVEEARAELLKSV
ncbi:hypothetical protein CI109_103013 [Kwoniella shandongensis]|uniref:histidine kinase n=1 Tax=Kwoniella shandongensis TaxID=1734106 RepID=A0AAJ8MV28_9TREE